MKYLALILFCCFAFNGFSQCDYSSGRFAVASEKKLLYGILPDYRDIQDSLFLDIYYPIGSPELQKPLVIWAFGGGFFQGAREDFATVCSDLASRGIVSATIDYRIGFDGPYPTLGPPFSYDVAEIIRAGYRGATDMKGAIRFLKAKSNQYGIDLDRVWIGGASAGSIVALNAAFLDLASEKPKETGAISPIGTKVRSDLGPIEGVLNQNGYDSKIQGVFNIFGALLDTNAINTDNKIAVFSYHQIQDPVVPCDARPPYYNYTFISNNYPVAYGTCVITERLKNIGMDPLYYETWIYQGNQHATHDNEAVIDFLLQQAKPFFCKTITNSNTTSSQTLDAVYIVPNLVSEYFEIKNAPDEFGYTLFNAAGQILKQVNRTTNRLIHVSNFESGVYFMAIQNGSSQKTLRWIKY